MAGSLRLKLCSRTRLLFLAAGCTFCSFPVLAVEFLSGFEQERNPCGGDSYQASARCRWTYPDRELTGEQFYQLKSLVGDNASVDVFITVPTQRMNLTTYEPVVTAYQADMHWPAEGVMMTQYYRWTMGDEGLLFTNLVGQ